MGKNWVQRGKQTYDLLESLFTEFAICWSNSHYTLVSTHAILWNLTTIERTTSHTITIRILLSFRPLKKFRHFLVHCVHIFPYLNQNLHLFRSVSISGTMSLFSNFGEYLLTGTPSWSIKNFSKFQETSFRRTGDHCIGLSLGCGL